MKKRRADGYKFSDKTHPVQALLSVVFAAIALITLLVLFIRSGLQGGKAGLSYGVIGVLMLFLSIAGTTLACISFRKSDIRYLFPILGAAANTLLLLTYAALYILGMMK